MFHLPPKSFGSCRSCTFLCFTVGAKLQVHYSHTTLLRWSVEVESLAKLPRLELNPVLGTSNHLKLDNEGVSQYQECLCAKCHHLRGMEVRKASAMQPGARRSATSDVCGGHLHYLESVWHGKNTN